MMNKEGLTIQQVERELIRHVIRYTSHIICDVVKPKKSVFIALDGPAPRAKMEQQRARRFKRIIDQGFKRYLRDKYELPDVDEWDSRKISPGTIFMDKLGKEIRKAIRNGVFSKHATTDGKLHITFSDSNIPGEGEHKIIPLIRDLRGDIESRVCIYGLDADLIVLAMGTGKNQILILREPKDSEIEKSKYRHCEFLYLSIDVIRQAFMDDLSVSLKGTPLGAALDVDRVFNDYVLLTFMGGNDFVRPISFLHIKEGGLNLMLAIYKEQLPNFDDYLVVLGSNGKPTINLPFFKKLVDELSAMEIRKMKQKQRNINRKREQKFDEVRAEREEGMSPFDLEYSRFQHLPFYIRDHPLFELYNPVIEILDFEKSIRIWREKYYEHFFGLDPKNDQNEYNSTRRYVAKNYIKSLCFTLEYYLCGIPSWTWYYKYRVAPLISDVQFVLKRFKSIDFKFTQSRPYTPFQQLMMIMPLDGGYLLPRECSKLMKDEEMKEWYPEEFAIDAAAGMKYIYAEPILPEIDDRVLIRKMKPIFSNKLNASEKKRNRLIGANKATVVIAETDVLSPEESSEDDLDLDLIPLPDVAGVEN